MSTNFGMAGWGLSTVEEKPLVHVIVIAVIALVAYFSWWKRRCDTVSGSNSIQLDERRQFPEGIPHTITGIVKTVTIGIFLIRVCFQGTVGGGTCDSIIL